MTIPIVDEKDSLLGYKERAEINYDQDIFRTASLWITNNRGDILLARRKLDKKVDPGKWGEAVGGTVEGEASYEETVLREAEEELGLKGVVIALGPRQFITKPCQYFVQWYTAVVDEPIESFVIQLEEVEEVAWIPKSRLAAVLREKPEEYIASMPEIFALFSR